MSECPKKTHLHLSSVLNSDTQNELEGEEALSTSRPPAEGAEGEEDRGESRRACRGPGRNGATTRRTRQPCTGGGKRLTTSPAAGPLGRRGVLLAGKMALFQSLGSFRGVWWVENALVHKRSGCLRGNH